MVKVKITKFKSGNFQKVEMKGHAEAGDYGNDLVCAALTGIMSGALNAFDQYFQNQMELVVTNNEITIMTKLDDNHEIELCFAFLIIQIKTIQVQYPKNVTLREVV